MKRCILSAISGALAMLVAIIIASNISAVREQNPKEYEHIDFISTITQEDCFMCGTDSEFPVSSYWGEDNVGIINLNTFEVLRLEINRYGDHGELIEEAAGYMQTSSLIDNENESYAHAYTFPDNGYANVNLTGVQYAINRDTIQGHLCQSCLDSINELCFGEDPPAEYGILSFEDRTIRPLITCTTGFGMGNYHVDCGFEDNGKIDLLIFYCPPRDK